MTKDTFKKFCAYGAGLVTNPRGLDPYSLLYAIGGVESSFGSMNLPRHEKAFDFGGVYAEKELLQKYGSWAAHSYGPWQMMYTNILRSLPEPIPPQECSNPYVAIVAAANWLNDEVLGRRKCDLVVEVADAWNTGNPNDQFKPAQWYTDRFQKYYDEARGV